MDGTAVDRGSSSLVIHTSRFVVESSATENLFHSHQGGCLGSKRTDFCTPQSDMWNSRRNFWIKPGMGSCSVKAHSREVNGNA
ncbi:hypothetical protein GDO78_021199 [Eleutherodactylus coqui]|uniref:Uncharacterized protein n=1 Tax=Eleutherodactylus coqui TaxID=57060 RepID=A0A8J6BEY2_ELECQ|nr:hypothetical protein GDO78_021199 [Eleutherodactylus coqui]